MCWFKAFFNTPVALFLNKKDIFRECLKHVPITICFGKDAKWPFGYAACNFYENPELLKENKYYEGPNYYYDENKNKEENEMYLDECFNCAIEYIKSIFIEKINEPKERLTIHCTNALDQNDLDKAFGDITTRLVENNLRNGHVWH